MNDQRPPGQEPPPHRRPVPPREPSQVIRRPPGYRPAPQWPPQPPTPHRAPPQPPPPPPVRRAPPPPAPPRQAAPPPAKPAKPRRRGRVRRGLALLTVLVLIALTAGVAGAVWFDTTLQRVPALADYPGRPAPGKGVTWLLVGSDSRQHLSPEQQAELATGGDVGNGRTDTILLIHIGGFGSGVPTTMVSLPRDSYVDIPGHGKDKINAAFAIGGAALLAQTVEQATGLRLDHYAEVGFDGFAELVDAVGGVTMCPAEPITDPLAGIDLPAGCQELDGRNALGFVRSRATPRADLDRMLNQRAFMSALLRRTASPAVLLNPLRWYPMVHAVGAALTVDQGGHVWDLARLGWALHGDAVTTTVPIGEFTSSDSGAVVVWDTEAAGRLFTALAADTAVPADVLNLGS
ncbi:LCP family protein [Mycolicibacterium sp. J2]|uniref:LCP family protein n=1 Tax=Mycolicibacterium sp. J2 TaxID=2993511 RepID=UPI003A4D83E7